MIILDENIFGGQRLVLEAWRLTARQVGVDLGRKGLKDEEIVVLLRQQRNSTFFTPIQVSISRPCGIEVTAWSWPALGKMKWPRSYGDFFATVTLVPKPSGWAR